MQEINELIKKYKLKPRSYKKNNKVLEIETQNGKYIIKPRIKENQYIYDYLKSRNFNYLPKIINNEADEYEIIEYIESYNIPKEQKMIDLINIICLLHNKTTHYIEATEDDYKKIYEDIKNNIEYLYSYYNDLITIIETKVYMSPSEYLLATNISKIFNALNFSNNEIEKWYELIKTKTKKRLVVLHNNLKLEHIITSDKDYLISWDKAKIGVPIFDLYKLYNNHALDFDFSEIFKKYEKNYPLYEDEKKLFFILISLPKKQEFKTSEFENTKIVSKLIEYIYKTERFISPYYSNKGPENNCHKQENQENIKST